MRHERMWPQVGEVLPFSPLFPVCFLARRGNVMHPAAAAASAAEGPIFMERPTTAVLDPTNNLNDYTWPSAGGAQFAEGYLSPEVIGTGGYGRLFDAALDQMIKAAEPGLAVPPDLLSPLQQDRLAETWAGR
jgi:hypothetical protein